MKQNTKQKRTHRQNSTTDMAAKIVVRNADSMWSPTMKSRSLNQIRLKSTITDEWSRNPNYVIPVFTDTTRMQIILCKEVNDGTEFDEAIPFCARIYVSLS